MHSWKPVPGEKVPRELCYCMGSKGCGGDLIVAAVDECMGEPAEGFVTMRCPACPQERFTGLYKDCAAA